ncbi:MAG TPA: VanZ family protein [Labilithrix sp.]|nr:VanZ family protein [Labilithrix sp.]
MVKAAEERRFIPLTIAVGFVIALSAVAYAGHVPRAVAAHGIDKILHAAMSFTLTMLLGRALRGRAWLAGLIVFVPLAIDEYLQRFSASRSSDWADLIADVLGIALAIALSRARRASRIGDDR